MIQRYEVGFGEVGRVMSKESAEVGEGYSAGYALLRG